MKRSPQRAVLLAGITGLLSGCQFDPYASAYTRHKPSEAALLGRYAVQQQGSAAETSAFIELLPDGQFRSAYPTGAPGPGWAYRDLDGRTSGTWAITENQNRWGINFGYQRTWGDAGRAVENVQLIGERQPYTLHFTSGDPDSGDAVQFAQQIPDVRPAR